MTKKSHPRREPVSDYRWLYIAAGVLVFGSIVYLAGGFALWPLSKARQAIANDQLESAEGWLRTARFLAPNDGEAEFLAARAARHDERFEDMRRHLRLARESGISSQRIRREEMLVRANEGELEGVEEELREWLAETDTDQAEICRALTNGLSRQARFDEVRLFLNAWQQDFPHDPEPHWRRARIMEHLRDTDGALLEYEQALTKDPHCQVALYGTGRILENRKQPTAAVEFYRRCAELPDAIPAKVGMAVCLKGLGQLDEAQRLLEEAVAVDDASRKKAYKAVGEFPESFVAATELGKLYSELGRHADAEAWLCKALEHNPRDLVARYALAVVLRDLGQTHEADKQFAMVKTARDALEKASTLYDYVESHPKDADARFRLGKILLQYESERSGMFYLNSVLALDPNHSDTRTLLATYEKLSPAERLEAFGGLAAVPKPTASSIQVAANADRKAAGSIEKLLATVPAESRELKFTDMTQVSGIDHVYRNSQDTGHLAILESLGGGVAIVDFDRDGNLDLCFPGGGRIGPPPSITGLPTTLWRSIEPFKYVNVTSPAMVTPPKHYTHGIAIGDYDNDGFCDMVVTGYGGLQLFQNNGDGTFSETASAAEVQDTRWSSSAAFGDLNGDGFLDLYVAHYVDWSWTNHPPCNAGGTPTRDVCSPREFNPLPDSVYYSLGDGRFRDATAEAGLVKEGKGLGVMAADIDGDHDVDVYVANDTTNNFLYVNDGKGNLTESGFSSGTAVDHRGIPNGSMGIAAIDYNKDLAADIWVTNYQNETFALYRNEGAASFLAVSESTGITALETLYVGFGTVAADIEHDGDEDIVITNGHVMYFPKEGDSLQEALVLVNDGRNRFVRQSFPGDSYFTEKHMGRGLACGDLDSDGDLDLVFSLTNERPSVVRNDSTRAETSVIVQLIGQESNRDAIGARAILHTSRGDLLRLVAGGGSYLSQNDLRLHWGLSPGTTISGLTVYWPSGAVQEVEVAQAGQRIVVEGRP